MHGLLERHLRIDEPVHGLHDVPERDIFGNGRLVLYYVPRRQGVDRGVGLVRDLVRYERSS